MTIALGQGGGGNANNATSVTRAFSGNVTTGSLIVVLGMKYSPTTDAFVAGDCTKSAGTATLGAFQLDTQVNQDMGSTDGFGAVGIWSAIVTGTGSLTVNVGGALAGSYLLIAAIEVTGSWDASRAEAVNSGSSATDNQTSFSSGNVTSAAAAILVGGLQHNSNAAQTSTPDAAFTEIYSNETGTDDNGAAAYRILSTAATDAFDGTLQSPANSTGWAAAIVAYKEAAGGADPGIPPQQRRTPTLAAVSRAANF